MDVFFVISGYLITTIIRGNFESGDFSYGDFYARRIRRVFPALILVLASTVAVGWFVLLPHDLAQLGKHAAAGAAFLSNIALWKEAGYFDVAANTKPLLHLWSLAIEEQFYLLWPLLLGFAVRRRWRIVTVVAVIAGASFALNVFTIEVHPTAAFYSPASRVWELMAGGMLACTHQRQGSMSLGRFANAQSAIGFGLLCSGLAFIRSSALFPGWWALLPTCGAYLLISAGPEALVNRKFLASKPMVWVGLISYPLYLWHWPLLVYARILDWGQGHWAVRAAALAFAFGLAAATYRFFEKPIRWGAGNQRVILSGLAAPMIIIAAVGLVVMGNNGFGTRLQGTPLAFAAHEYDFRSDALVGKCWVSLASPADSYSPECGGYSGDRPVVLVWGDSHAARLTPGLRKMQDAGASVAQFTRDSCPGVLGFPPASCAAANDYVLQQISSLRPHTVVLFGSWTHYAEPAGKLKASDLRKTTDALRAAGVENIIVMGPAPRWTDSLPANLFKLNAQNMGSPVPAITNVGLEPEAMRIDTVLRGMVETLPGVAYFSTYGALCNERGCLTMVDNSPEGLTTWDYGHLTTSGATVVVKGLAASLEREGRSEWLRSSPSAFPEPERRHRVR